MPGSPKKPPHLRRGRGTRDVVLRVEQPPVPRVPNGLLPATRKLWRDYWGSWVARAVDPISDQHIVKRWIKAVDEYERMQPVFESTRLVKGSTGQLVLNPLGGYLATLKEEIRRAESELGLTPMARLRLGITANEARISMRKVEEVVTPTPTPTHEEEDPRRFLSVVS